MDAAAGALIAMWPLVACVGDPAERPAEPSTAVDRRIDEAVAAGFSGVVLVRSGSSTTLRSSGLADRANGVPNGPAIAYDVGSITKDLTAAAVFRLQEQGLVDLDDPLSAYFPEAPPDKAGIVLRDVVRHRAGFRTYHDTGGDFEPMTREEARRRILAQELRFPPGSRYGYSNSGYTLLADLIETRTGSYVDFVRTELLDRAGLGATGFYGDVPVDAAIGYDAATYGDNDPASWPYTWALVGNGGLVSAVGDLDRWFDAVPEVLDDYDTYVADYLADGAVEIDGDTVYSYAGAGDFGLGGSVVDSPARERRVIVVTNAYTAYDSEQLTVDLALLLLRPTAE